jgi:hypothetical protein
LAMAIVPFNTKVVYLCKRQTLFAKFFHGNLQYFR